MSNDSYLTIQDRAENSFIERKSEFIGYICPIKTEEEALSFIDEIRSMHRKATHNVFAYIVRNDNITRYSDDGEPQGTAGIPVLNVLQKECLTDVACVVTRYFGGIMLGAGGLVRAYSHGAKIAVESAEVIKMAYCDELVFTFDYTLYGKVNGLFSRDGINVIDRDFTDTTKIHIYVMSELTESFIEEVIECCRGQFAVQNIQKLYCNMSYNYK